jgi:hypothetical protein
MPFASCADSSIGEPPSSREHTQLDGYDRRLLRSLRVCGVDSLITQQLLCRCCAVYLRMKSQGQRALFCGERWSAAAFWVLIWVSRGPRVGSWTTHSDGTARTGVHMVCAACLLCRQTFLGRMETQSTVATSGTSEWNDLWRCG